MIAQGGNFPLEKCGILPKRKFFSLGILNREQHPEKVFQTGGARENFSRLVIVLHKGLPFLSVLRVVRT